MTIEFHTKPPFISPSNPPDSVHLADGGPGRRHKHHKGPTPLTPQRFRHRASAARSRSARTCSPGITAPLPDSRRDRRDCRRRGAAVGRCRRGAPPPATCSSSQGRTEQHYVAWLPVVPRADVELTLAINGEVEHLRGTGYHDHNWGNVALRKIIDHWYWGRACIGDYTVVSLMFTGASESGGLSFPSFMVAKDGEILMSAIGPRADRFSGRRHRRARADRHSRSRPTGLSRPSTATSGFAVIFRASPQHLHARLRRGRCVSRLQRRRCPRNASRTAAVWKAFARTRFGSCCTSEDRSSRAGRHYDCAARELADLGAGGMTMDPVTIEEDGPLLLIGVTGPRPTTSGTSR